MVLVDFFPPGDGIDGVLVGLLVDTLPFCGVPSFFPADLLGVNFMTFSTYFLTSADSDAFFTAFLPLEAAFFFPLTPPFTLAAGYAYTSSNFLKASFPFSIMKTSCNLRTAVFPSLKEYS